jgi:dihydroflavonol-4-reductase
MRVLVTGSTGVVGASLVRELLGDGHDVRVLVRPKSDRRALEGLQVEPALGDVLDPASLRAAADGCEVVYHAASIFSYWGHSAEELHRTAVEGVRNALDAAKDAGARRVVLTSSSVTLGSSARTVPLDESSEPQGGRESDPDYYRSKVAQERAAFEHATRLDIELVAVCPTIVIGPHDYRLSPSNGIIFAYWEDPVGTTWPGGINLVHAEDVARGHILAAERGVAGERYVLGAENLEWSLIHRTIAELSGLPPPRVLAGHAACYFTAAVMEAAALLTAAPPRTTRAQARQVGRFYWYRHDKAAELGYAPRPARQALSETIAWMLVKSPHVPRALRARLHLSREVLLARELFLG